MTTGLNEIFTLTAARSGQVFEYAGEPSRAFVWQPDKPGVVDTLLGAVESLRSLWVERGLDAGVLAARDGVDAVINHILKGKRFTTARDASGLDAGYYVARYCLPYDFVAVGVVAQCGAVSEVQRLRYYNQHPDGRAAFLSALDAGLTFSDCADDEHHNAGFYVARSGDEEIIARYEAAGGTFRQPELEFLGRGRSLYKAAG